MARNKPDTTVLDPKIDPLVGAVTVGLSFFVGLMSLIVAVMAFATAGRQDAPNAGQSMGWTDVEAARIAYVTGTVAVINSLVAFGRGRLRPWIMAASTIVFLMTVYLANSLFGRVY